MGTKLNSVLGNQSGAALVIALIMIIVITLIALASSYTSIFEIKISGNKRGSTDAFYTADGGVNVIVSQPTSSFDTRIATLNKRNWFTDTTTNNVVYYPFSDPTVLNPTNIPYSNAPVTYIINKGGPPRGGGYSAIGVSYEYFQVQCAGNDSAGSGTQAIVQEDMVLIAPAPQQ